MKRTVVKAGTVSRLCAVFLMSLLSLVPQTYNLSPLYASGLWSTPDLVYESANIERPVLVGDPSGVLHSFWSGLSSEQSTDDANRGIFYARRMNGSWSIPRDIIARPEGGAYGDPEAIIDGNGMIHLFWIGPYLYSSVAPVVNADNPHSWTERRELSEGNSVAGPFGVVLAPDGRMHILFAVLGGDVYHRVWNPKLARWSDLTRVSNLSQGIAASGARLAVDRSGKLHATWNLQPLPDGYPPLGVSYAYSGDGGTTWSDAVSIAETDYGEATIATDQSQSVHVIYSGRVGVGGKYHRISKDGGKTWSDSVAVLPPQDGIGLTGVVGLAVDTANRLHLLANDGLYAFWNGEVWSSPQRAIDLAALSLGYSEDPALGLLNGNQVHAMIWTNRAKLLHAWLDTDAPSSEVSTYPTAPPNRALRLTPARMPPNIDIETDETLEEFPRTRTKPDAEPPWPLLISLFSSGVFVTAVLAILETRRRR